MTPQNAFTPAQAAQQKNRGPGGEYETLRKVVDVKRHGKFYTPTDLASFLAERVLTELDSVETLTVLDPACGDGELLFAVHRIAIARFPDAVIRLTGYDLDPDAIDKARARAEALGLEVDWHVGDFLEVGRTIAIGSFDAIITNPPYVRTQQLGQATAQLLALEFGLKGRIDLTHPFVTMSPSLLRPGGVLGLLCSNRFLTTKAGANVRQILQTALRPVALYDLGDTKLFDAAVLPAIVIALNEPNHSAPQRAVFASAYETSEPVGETSFGLFEALVGEHDSIAISDERAIAVKVGTLEPAIDPTAPWRISHAIGDEWLEGINAATWKTFGDVAKIRVGIKSTADSVFISDQWESSDPRPEEELLLPLVTHHNVTPWRIDDRLPTRVLYPYDLSSHKRATVDIKRFPQAMSYFELHADRLKGRSYVVDGGRQWWELWVPQRPSVWASAKIVFPDISEHARFAYDRTGAVINGDCYWISADDIGSEDLAFLMIAVANSDIGTRFYDEVCGNKLYSGRRRWITQYVSRFPIPDPSSDQSQSVISAVRNLLATGSPVGQDTSNQINRLVEEAFTVPAVRRAGTPTLF
jgi:adenine-specific DNA-methyltransferase